MSSDVTEHTCRICRGEATQQQPLYHPCKCRGSIKYVHQDCLMEWLKHANKSTEKCDICDTPYRFRIIYDPAMPQSVPLSLVWMKLLQVLSSTLVKAIAMTLYILCILVQVPLFLKFAGRVYTWAIDGSLPTANQTLLDALFFGEYDINGYLSNYSSTPITPIQLAFVKLRKFLGYTYFSGVRYILAAIIIHIALFIEREWVVRDEGYLKLLHKKIGKEPRTKLVDMLQNALQSLRNDGDNGDAAAAAHLQRLETLAQAINDLQNENNDINAAARGEEGLRRAINENQLFADDESDETSDTPNAGQPGPIESNRANAAIDADINLGQANGDNVAVAPQRNFIHDIFGDENDDYDDEDDANNHHHRHNNNYDDGDFNHDGLQDSDGEMYDDEDEDIDDDDEEAAAIAAAAAAAAENVNGNNLNNQGQGGAVAEFLEMFGITLSVKTPVYLMLLFDFVIAVYLFLIYLIPHMLGNLVVALAGLCIHGVGALVVYSGVHNMIDTKACTNWVREAVGYLGFVQSNILSPVAGTINRMFVGGDEHYTWVDRVLLLSVGYGIIGCAIYKIMLMIRGGDGKPITGTPRKVYKVLFEIACTLKVGAVLKTEIVLFPIFCGWLLDLTARPFIPDGKYILPSSHYETSQVPYIRGFLYWSSGTIFMIALAIMVDATRKKILRSGVLFFLRTPDDPNVRLIHDALMVPLKLQAHRIWLTMKVYSVFILAGVGTCTWTMAKLVGPPDYSTLFVSSMLLSLVTKYREEMKEHGLEYLKKVIVTVAHKLRLSHYLINTNHATERGYFVRWYHKLLGSDQAMHGLTVEEGVFVPNGTYMRVPASDSVPKRYLKNLFVKVTKDDNLIEAVESHNVDTESEATGYESDGEEDGYYEEKYDVIYVPPYFKTRAYLSVIFIFTFSIFVPVLLGYACLQLAGRVVSKLQFTIEIYPDTAFASVYAILAFSLAAATVFVGVVALQKLQQFLSSLKEEVVTERYMRGRELINSEST